MSDDPKSTLQLLAEGEALRESYKLRYTLLVAENARLKVDLADEQGAAGRMRKALEEIWETVDSLYSEDREGGVGRLPDALLPWSGPISIIARIAHEAVRPDLAPAVGDGSAER